MFERMLEFQARQNPDSTAIWSDGAEITFATLERHVGQFTAAFAREALPPRSIVLLNVANAPLSWLVTLALERLGHATVCVLADVAAQVALIQPDVVVTADARFAGEGLRVIMLNEAWRKQAFAQSPGGRPSPAAPDDLIRIVLSSGTTGVKKQIPITRRQVDARIGMAAQIGPAPHLRFLATMGLDTISGFNRPLSAWAEGGAVVFSAAINEEVLKNSRPNLTSVSPVKFKELLKAMSNVFSVNNPLRVVVGGSAMPPTLIQEGLACPGLEVLISYGSTEAGIVAYGPARLSLARPGAVGYITPWAQVEVIGEDGAPAPLGQTGEIRVRGAGQRERSAADAPSHPAFRDGWFYPNDRGRLDPDGVLVVEGRTDDVINIGGVKHSATRIEEVMLGCDGVEDAAVVVFPMASAQWRAFAAVVSSAGYVEQDIARKVEQTFGFEVKIVGLARIPRNPMGKIIRAQVREAILAHERK